MAEFYTWTLPNLIPITFLIALCILAQTPAMVISWYRRNRSRLNLFENLLELFVLVQVFILALMHGQVLGNYDIGLIAPIGYGGLSYAAVAAALFIILFSCIITILTKKAWPLLAVAISCLTFPAIEAIAGNMYAWFYISALFFWLFRGICMCVLRYREIRTNLSAFSVKNAIDSLNTGVIFSEPDGQTLLYNVQMQQLMTLITGKVQRNVKRFYDLISSGEIQPDCKKAELEGQSVILLPDGSAWMFTKTILTIKKKEYTQITATDITERWKLTAELQRQNDELAQKGEELTAMIDNLHILSREQETQKVKMRAHDILGEKLTLLLRSIRNEQSLDYDLLRSLAQGLMDELKTDDSAPVPQDELDSLRRVFERIGVIIALDGELPEDSAKGRLFVDIIKEGTTNAVRHGFATTVSVQIGFSENAYRLIITDNGRSVSDEFAEGGGIGGIRKKLMPFGGVLTVASSPAFVLTIVLPGGDASV